MATVTAASTPSSTWTHKKLIKTVLTDEAMHDNPVAATEEPPDLRNDLL